MHLDSLPSKISIAKDSNLLSSLVLRETLAINLVIYTPTMHHSFITSAEGSLKVPSMPPGTLKFVVANSLPERKAAFQAEIDGYPPNTTTRILFHDINPDKVHTWPTSLGPLGIIANMALVTIERTAAWTGMRGINWRERINFMLL